MKIPFSVYDFFGYLAAGFLLLCAVDYSFDLGYMGMKDVPPGLVLFLFIGSYVAGHIISHLSSFLLEHKFLRGILTPPEETLFAETVRNKWKLAFPIYYRPFPPETQKKILDRAKAAGIERPGRGLFFHCFAIVKQSKSTAERLSIFLSIYGFCRNVCMVSIISAPILVWGSLHNLDWSTGIGFEKDKLTWAGVSILVGIGLFYRYLKFFKHYTEEVFRDYAEHEGGC